MSTAPLLPTEAEHARQCLRRAQAVVKAALIASLTVRQWGGEDDGALFLRWRDELAQAHELLAAQAERLEALQRELATLRRRHEIPAAWALDVLSKIGPESAL